MTNIKIPNTEESATFTFTEHLDPGFADPIDLVATIPTERPPPGSRNKVAMMLILGAKDTRRTPMGCYIYSVYDQKRNEAVQTILNNSEEALLDMTKKLGNIITKKFQTPSYVCINGGVDATSFLAVVKAVLECIERKFGELEQSAEGQE